jgi:hypothetical protein
MAQSNKNMSDVWETNNLVADYWTLPTENQEGDGGRMLREINNDDMTPKRSDHNIQTDLFLRENTNN